jgi:hypothetical protein
VVEDSPEEKPLRPIPFAIHATRGVVRDQTARRKVMFFLLLAALLLVFAGSTFLASWLSPREHLLRALFFWIACVWLTLTALVLAFFDLLMVRMAARAAQRLLSSQDARPNE